MNFVKREYDVVIVGGGPAGGLAAKHLAEKGWDVLIIERRDVLGTPVRCGEGLSHEWIERMNISLTPSEISYKINRVKVYSPSLKELVYEGKGYILNRKEFDKKRVLDALDKGADLLMKSTVYDLVKEEGYIKGVKVRGFFYDGEIKAKIVIAADGLESTVARMAGINSVADFYETDFGFEYEIKNIDVEDAIELYFGNEIAPRGYVWVFPKGEDMANFGVGIMGGKGHAMEYLHKFMDLYKDRFKNIKIVELKGGAIPVGLPLSERAKNGFVVIGTAAKEVDPIHGGGIGLAMYSGRLVAEVVNQALENEDYSQNILKQYQERWDKGEMGKKMRLRYKIRRILEKLSDSQ